MEMKIPFKTLRFADTPEQIWGLQMMRLIRRKNEVTMWSPVPRQFTQFKVSYAGVLTGLRGISPGRNLRIKPFVTGVGSNTNLPNRDRPWNMDGGFDMKYGVGSALVLDTTFRTDFSQVEADDQQVNLTRFSLFFPEKREFFLENQGAFRIGDQDSTGQSGGSTALSAPRHDLLPFFSRRIGLSEAGEPIPIVAGARLTGKQRGTTIGLLNIQTRGAAGDRGDNFTAVRLGRDIGQASAVSLFYLGRESTGPRGSNRIAGGEFHLNFRRTIDVNGFGMASTAPGANGFAGRAAINIAEQSYLASAAYTNVADGFRDDLGFVPRRNIGLFTWDASKNVRPKRTYRWIRQYAAGSAGEIFETSSHDTLLSRRVAVYTAEDFADGGTFRTDVNWEYERLTSPYEISRGVFVPPGEYRFRQIVPAVATSRSRTLAGTVKYTNGTFYSGTIDGVEGSVRIRASAHLAGSLDLSRSRVELPQGAFTSNVRRVRLDYSFTTHMFLNALVQYNSATGAWSTNVRYRFIYRPLSDFFVVWSETRAGGIRPQRSLSVKHTLQLSF
jgi:hypothetical protein